MDPISDMLIRIKNAQAVKADQVLIPFSKSKFQIAGIFKEKGFLSGVERKKKKEKKSETEYLLATLKYSDNQGAIHGIKIISRPSRRIYIGAKDIKPVRSGYGIAVISTPEGIMDSREARKKNLGGELMFEIY
ncbi:MAG: 30S ribosomal protein S8 [Candidatus Yanofskybacteria bacterium RIFCSPHIGHO2_01_FULL_44_22]|uniref:Small ribosomal subunit protein uS8 n=1 Tax=Candidatus Yanofskybacteria bacterium RIFCSPHIGHO2_01_FULL_44_22 TaxID=1802669 RepID=A0A1F8ESZ6_9BACT|nr:MAG: 30S ribosomal protein S8 [Candidatus Yanofskybacteria bacterium RIFCSPHIGHO2_01_FULL_44_22]